MWYIGKLNIFGYNKENDKINLNVSAIQELLGLAIKNQINKATLKYCHSSIMHHL